MFNGLPDKINEALDLLAEYSTDYYAGIRSKIEIKEEGFECEGKAAFKIEFVIEIPDKINKT